VQGEVPVPTEFLVCYSHLSIIRGTGGGGEGDG
jgi:hypothetical protein